MKYVSMIFVLILSSPPPKCGEHEKKCDFCVYFVIWKRKISWAHLTKEFIRGFSPVSRKRGKTQSTRKDRAAGFENEGSHMQGPEKGFLLLTAT